MFTAQVYRVMIGCLGGIMEEVHQAKMVVKEWNDKNAEPRGKVFLPVDWSAKVEDMNQADIIVGIIGDWIENPEFVEECIKSGKKVILFFHRNHNPDVSIRGEVMVVEAFKNDVQKKCKCLFFGNVPEFKEALSSQMHLID